MSGANGCGTPGGNTQRLSELKIPISVSETVEPNSINPVRRVAACYALLCCESTALVSEYHNRVTLSKCCLDFSETQS